jgi:hypothetical protein
MRKIAFASAAILVASLLLPTTALAASPKAGASCSKAGLISSTATKKFTCVKSGKKLVWDKGVAITKPATADNKPSAANLPIPFALPVAQNGAITFANAATKFSAIPETAWQRTQDAIAANPAVTVPTEILIGPNTQASKSAITTALDRINKLFAGFRYVSKYSGIVYSAKDVAWAQSQAYVVFNKTASKSSGARKDVIKQLSEAGCEINGTTVVNCGGGMALDFSDGRDASGGAFYGVQSDGDYWSDSTKNVGPMTQVTHEAMHNYQTAQFFFTPLGKNQNISSDLKNYAGPWWFSEGQANAIGIATFYESLPNYLSNRDDTVTRSPGSRATVPAATAASMKAFLTSTQIPSPENPNYMLGYSVGYAAVEALVAIGGPQSTLALYTLCARGEKWDTAFKSVYGISWDEGSTVLSEVLAAQYSAKPISKG